MMSTAIAPSATSTPASAMPARIAICLGRATHYQAARQRTPRRWSRQTRNWTPAGAVTLNPERDAVIGSTIAQRLPSGSIGAPAFPSRPATAKAVARNEGEERSGATRSHPQRAPAREHGEDGEHRTFPAMSTTAASVHGGQTTSIPSAISMRQATPASQSLPNRGRIQVP
jgi:hypothetical protein